MRTENSLLRLTTKKLLVTMTKAISVVWRERYNLDNVDTLDVRGHKHKGDI